MTFKLVVSCAGLFASAGAAVTRANHRTAIAVDAEGGTSLVDAGVPHVDTLLQSIRGIVSDKKGATKMVGLVEDLAKRAAATVGAGPDMALVSNIKDFAQSILDHTTSNHQGDQQLLQEKLAAIEGCPALHTRLMNEAIVMRGEMEGDRGAHESCRGAEAKLAVNRSSLCDEYDAYRVTIDSDINECTSTWFLEDNVAKDETVDEATVTKMESCLGTWTPWIEELHRLYLVCDAAAGAHDDKVGICNEMQVDFEHGFCEYHHKLGDHCEQMSRCYDNAVEDQAITHTQVEARQEARKSDWTAGRRIACYARVFETVDPAEKQTVLSGCQTEAVTTDHLNLSYPATPARPECTLTDSHPCDRDTWQRVEYFSKAWFAKAPTAECRPCSQK